MLLQPSQTKFRRRLTRAIALPIVLSLLLSGIFVWQITRLLSALEWVNHTSQVISQGSQVQNLFLEMETGFRGYLLTGNREFLKPYEQANAAVEADLEQLKTLVSDNPGQVQRVNELTDRSRLWKQQVVSALARKQRGEPEPLDNFQYRKQLIEHMRRQVATFISTEEQLRNQRSQTVQQTTQSVILTSLLLAIGVGAILAYFIHRQISRVSHIYEGALHTAHIRTGEAEQAAIALQRSAQRLAALHDIDRAILAAETDETLIGNALIQLHQVVSIEQVFVAVFDIESGIAQVLAGDNKTGALNPPIGTTLAVTDFSPEQTGLRGVRYIEKLSASEAYPPILMQLRSRGFCSCLCVPLLADNVLVGELNLASIQPAAFDEEAQEIAREVAAQLAIALQQSRLQQQIQFSNQQLQRELSERQQTEIELREQEQLFRSTFNQAAVGIAHVSLSGQWLRVNQKLCEIVGYTREELLQLTFQDISHPQDLDRDLAYIRQILANEISTYSIEKRYRCKDNSLIWINLTVSLVRELDGQPKYFISVVENISDRKRAEAERQQTQEALRQSEERFRLALLNAPLPTLLYTEDGEVLQVNRVWTEITGYSIQDIPTLEDWMQRAYGDLKDRVQAEVAQIDPLNTSTATGEYVIHTAMGTRRIWKIYASPLEEVADKTLVVAMAIDVTEQKHAEEALRQLNATLEQRVADRTAQLEETNQELEAFTYSVSHDLRAPLRTIQGFATALLEDCGEQLEAFCRSYIDSIADDAVQMNGLISDLLDYSRLTRTQIHLQPTALDEAVDHALKQLTVQIKEKQAQIHIAAPLPQVMAHRATLIQVITNLIGNAIKFTEPNIQPQIDIFATPERQDDHEWIRLWIVDNGIGVALEHQERVFRVFERLHGAERYPGTGIGLAIVRKGLDRMGGRAGVESQLGQGSRFWIALPSAVLATKAHDTPPPSAGN